MGVETELFGIKNRGDGKEFRVVEKADGSIAVYAGDVALIEPGKIPVTAAPSAQGVRFPIPGIPDAALAMILPASILPGPVAITGATAETLLHSFVIPKECHGLTTRLVFAILASMTNNANTKTFRVRIGSSLGSSVVVGQSAPSNVNQLSVPGLRLKNRGSKTDQVGGFSLSLNAGTSGTPPSSFTLDFTADQTCFVTGQLAVAGDTATLEDFEMQFGG